MMRPGLRPAVPACRRFGAGCRRTRRSAADPPAIPAATPETARNTVTTRP